MDKSVTLKEMLNVFKELCPQVFEPKPIYGRALLSIHKTGHYYII